MGLVPVKTAAELLLDWGEVVCVRRVGWRRVYDLAERVLPSDVLAGADMADAECLATLVARAGTALGVATAGDLADYFRLTRADVATGLPSSGLVPVRVQGWDHAAWADPAGLADVGQRGRHRTTLLSPFDSLIWDRARTLRVFGLHHRLEAYTQAAARIHGYFAMPVLAGGRLVGRVDPVRSGATLVARRVSLVPAGPAALASAVISTAEALREASGWVGASDVAVEVVDPARAAPALRAALAA